VAVLTIPNIFVTGTTINAAPFNTNFSAVQTAVNSIDNTNIGAAGIFASQLLPTTSAQATFGGAIGYQFLAPSASTVPLTISGVTSQSANIFDVTLTSGGTQAMWVNDVGAVNVGANSLATLVGDLGISRSASTAKLFMGGATHSFSIDYGVTATGQLSLIDASGIAVLTVGQSGFGAATGIIQLSAATAFNQIEISSATINTITGTMFGFLANSTPEIVMDVNGNLGINGALHQTSSIASKKNIADLSFSPLDLVVQTEWKQYQLLRDTDDKQPHVGFLAEHSSEWLAGKSKDSMVPSDMAAIAAASVKELTLRLRAAGIAF
jgi:hypothetical protein